VTVAQQFGDNLRRCRKRAGISQEEAAVRASLHRTAIGQLERAERTARIDTLIKLAGAVDASPAELLEGLAWEPGAVRPGAFVSTSQNRP
jgi:transcriptional regulator with XRE-family HTH domain